MSAGALITLNADARAVVRTNDADVRGGIRGFLLNPSTTQ